MGKVKKNKIELIYTVPAQRKNYLLERVALNTKIIINRLSKLTPGEREKLNLIKDQYPDADLRFIVSNPDAPIEKGSTVSIGNWLTDRGFLWAKHTMPEAWLKEIQKQQKG